MLDYTPQQFAQWSRIGSRKIFGKIIQELALENSDLFVIAADVARASGMESFLEKETDCFYNAGISEQNMVAMAAGLALENKNVFVTSFAPFSALRPFEAIRTLVGLMHLNVKIVGLSSGFSMGAQGNSHYALEDIALMRTIPGMSVLSPSDCVETAKCLEFLAQYKGPAYIRLTGIPGTPNIHRENYDFVYGKIECIREGDDVAVFATGAVVNECVRAARMLAKDDISCSVHNVHTIKPLDTEYIEGLARKSKLIVTAEEHSIVGGLGGTVAELLSSKGLGNTVLRLGVDDLHLHEGDYAYMLEQSGLTSNRIREKILSGYGRVQ
ncbi:MAG: transketolase family protein [Fibrobacter sp.]|uniref:transketolase family protein n=1 Tax=Fibrobacter sp. TaxID=35828 RepID=UPI0025BF22E2|nr:transketolase C-terminal domain-containing protein [Fibrobacter sp.]MBQ7080096.1 transketolase family protein [Fibrobacter sp.]